MPKKHKPTPHPFPTTKGKNPKESLNQLLERLKIPADGPKAFDLLLIGDGSGCNWKIGAGWGCVSIERLHEEEPQVWYGAVNRGTVNIAEMMAYIPPLAWYAQKVEYEIKHSPYRAHLTRNVHIVTDSQYCKSTGSNNHALVQANGPLWQIFSIFQRHGLLLHWHWRPREDVALNVYADALSKAARLGLCKLDIQKMVEHSSDGQLSRTVKEYNPWQ